MFNLKGATWEIILTSQPSQTRKNADEGIASVAQNTPLHDESMEKGIESVQRSAPNAETVDLAALART